jgi:hypothetical protein
MEIWRYIEYGIWNVGSGVSWPIGEAIGNGIQIEKGGLRK